VALQLINLDEHDEALAAVDAVLIEDPHHGAIRHQRARLLSMGGEHETALREVDDAIADLRTTAAEQTRGAAGVPVLAQATLLRADLLMKLGREAEAVEEVRAVVADEPDYPEALFLLGNALVRRGDRSGTELLQRFRRLSDGREHRQLGDQFLRRNNDPERARAEYEAALQALPDDAGSLLGLGAVQRQTDQVEQAVATLRRARSAGADGVEWHREWVLALHSAGRPEEARQAWREAVRNGLVLGSEVRALMLESVPGC
jgi:Flp pilus assembly protein TadD